MYQLRCGVSGSAAALSDVDVVAPTFTADVPGSYLLALVVNDGEKDSAEDRVTVTAAEANAAPVANAGRDHNAVLTAAKRCAHSS